MLFLLSLFVVHDERVRRNTGPSSREGVLKPNDLEERKDAMRRNDDGEDARRADLISPGKY